MRYNLSWQTVVVFCATLAASLFLVVKGIIGKEILAALLTWLLPSPLAKQASLAEDPIPPVEVPK